MEKKLFFFDENAYSNFYGIFDYLPNRKIERKKTERKFPLSYVSRLLLTEKKTSVISEELVITSQRYEVYDEQQRRIPL